MDDKERTYWILAIVAGILLLLFWRYQSRPGIIMTTGGSNDGFYAPYSWPSGIYPDSQVLNGAAEPFQSTVNVYVSNPAISQLSQQYIPLFGFVGMVGV